MAGRLSIGAGVVAVLLICTTVNAGCFAEAAHEYGLSENLLRLIAAVESGNNPMARRHNSNGTTDIGIMQINSIWRSHFGERWASIERDVCENIKAGAHILSKCIARYGETWQAVGCYHSKNPQTAARYIERVWQVWEKAR